MSTRLQRLALILSLARRLGIAAAVAGLAVTLLGSIGCSGQGPGDDADPPTGGGGEAAEPRSETAASGPENTFDHPAGLGGEPITARDALERMKEQGPPAYRARVHTCRKMRYQSIGRVLASLGVDLGADAEDSAGRMWREADQALGAPNYGARVPEKTDMTVASASRLFDILVQAAPEIIANLPEQEHCSIGGTGARVFDDSGECQRDGLTCLLGTPATDTHVALCNDTVERAPTVEEGQEIAVASLLAASMTCE